MARIHVTTDQGEVMASWTDGEDEIGDVLKSLNRSRLIEEIADNVDKARRWDKRRGSDGAPLK